MKEDLAIAKNTILHMQDDNDRLRKDRGLPTQQQQEQLDREVSTDAMQFTAKLIRQDKYFSDYLSATGFIRTQCIVFLSRHN